MRCSAQSLWVVLQGFVLGFGPVLQPHAALLLHASVSFDQVTHMPVMRIIRRSAHLLTCRCDCFGITVLDWLYSCNPGSLWFPLLFEAAVSCSSGLWSSWHMHQRSTHCVSAPAVLCCAVVALRSASTPADPALLHVCGRRLTAFVLSSSLFARMQQQVTPSACCVFWAHSLLCQLLRPSVCSCSLAACSRLPWE